MHPIIRLACFILLVAGLSVTSNIIFILPLFLFVFIRYCTFSSVLPFLKRLRWFFLSLFILNLWFTSATFTLLPNMLGILLALERVIVLIIFVLAAHLLLATTPTPHIIAALQWYLMPLNIIGFNTDKLATRLALVLDIAQTVQTLYVKKSYKKSSTISKNPIKIISNKVSGLLLEVLTQAETTPLRSLEIPHISNPPLWQWAYPLLIFGFLLIGK